MEREKLLEEYKVTLDSLVEKTKFCYSEEFYKLDEFDKKKYQNDKMATEGHLSTLCNLLWGAKFQMNGLSDMMGLSFLSLMLGSGFGFPSSSNLPSVENLNKILEEENKSE